MIRDPSTSDPIELCDWAELQSIVAARKSCTKGDLIKYIEIDDLDEDADVDEHESSKDERIADSVLGIAQSRAALLGDTYPFLVSSGEIKPRNMTVGAGLGRAECYLFHLLFAGLQSTEISPEARHFFEIESKELLHDFFGGEAFHFGWTVLNAAKGKIQARIEEFCEECSMGWKPRRPVLVPATQNDLGIDAIIWKQPADRRENAVVVVGQCASGRNWDTKLDSNAANLLTDCLEATPSGPIIYCLLTPYQIPDGAWRLSARSLNGLLFDRLRMVLEAHQGAAAKRGRLYDAGSQKWVREVWARLMASATSKKRGQSGRNAKTTRRTLRRSSKGARHSR